MALKASRYVIVLEGKLLIVGDSVMGCFLEAPGDGDASPAAVCRLVRACSSNSRSCEGKICPVDSLILSYQLDVPYHPERCPKKDTFLVEAPLFGMLIKLSSLSDCQA